MSLHPLLPLPLAVLLALLLLLGAAWLCRGACLALPRWSRRCCVLLAALAALGMALLLLNPCSVSRRPLAQVPVWIVGLDVSASMQAPVRDDAAAPSRLEVAREALRALDASVRHSGREVRWLALSDAARSTGSAAELMELEADAPSSRVLDSLTGAIESLRRRGRVVAGALLISDGRDSHPQGWQSLVGRAGAAGCPVHVLPLGASWKEPDIALDPLRPLVVAYPGVPVSLSARLGNTRMGDRQLLVELLDPSGRSLETRPVESRSDGTSDVSFRLDSAAAGEYLLRVAVQPGESRADNNECRITVSAADSRIRVFLAEGAPYWDSKFLAQYLRAQPVFDVRSVHRLSDHRFYHINSGDDDAEPSDSPEMPTTPEGLMGYDIVVLGKGMETLLDAEAVKALQSYLRDQGGIVVMARGRCYAGRLEGMEELEPFVWSSASRGEARFVPTPEGEQSGLFGQALPAASDPIWKDQPPLAEVREVAELRAQTRVLAASEDGETPLLGLMRCGMGAVACINGEGLWKWDFYPDARERGNLYREFWRRFLPWVQTAAEFSPGFDLSLHPERASVPEGEGVVCRLGWRGTGRPDTVQVEAVSLRQSALPTLVTAVPQASAGLPRWEAALPALPAGEYLLRARTPGLDTPSPSCRLTVRPAPGERDCLDADPELLARVAEATGGVQMTAPPKAEQLAAFLATPPGVRTDEELFTPLWPRWPLLAFIVICLGLLWFIRRRKGLP